MRKRISMAEAHSLVMLGLAPALPEAASQLVCLVHMFYLGNFQLASQLAGFGESSLLSSQLCFQLFHFELQLVDLRCIVITLA